MKNKLTLAFLFCALFVLTHKVEAQIPLAQPFGGPILMTYECTCSGSWLVVMYDYKTMMPTPMVFRFGTSILKANYNIFTPKVQTLGSYIPDGGICLMASADCAGFTTNGTISPIGMPGVGTSVI